MEKETNERTRKRKKRKEKGERKEREGCLEIFQNNLHSLQRFCLKKMKGMMEKGRESDKFNDVCSKLRLEK